MAERARRRRRRQRRALAALLVAGALVIGTAVVLVSTRDSRHPAPVRAVTARAPRHRSLPTTSTTTSPLQRVASPVIAAENALPGTRDWNLTNEGRPSDIEGFTDRTSVQRGDTVTLFVSTTAPSFTVEAYRMGWYQGNGGRRVWSSDPIGGRRQPAPVTTPAAGTSVIEAHWAPSLALPIDARFLPGDYLVKLVASTGPQRLVPLTVRDDTSHSAALVVNAVTTWQAYNRWGGCSLYACATGGATRAKVVSFDRPYDASTGGASDFLGNELPFVMRVEEAGLDVSYATDVDLHEHPELLTNHHVVISLGHDEYWSKSMRDGAERARDAGVNWMFLGANAIYRQIRFEASPLGPDRREVNYRSPDDPIRRSDPNQVTVSFREAPVSRPEASLIGEQYECNPVRADMVIVDPGAWPFAGTGVTAGQHLEIAVGSEYDRYVPGQGGPPDVEVLAHSPVRCGGHASFADMTYYRAPSGAGVFATGTGFWVSKLTPPDFPDSPANPVALTVTRNVLLAFAVGPAGAAHPSVPNWQGLPGLRSSGPTVTTAAPGE